VADQYASLTDQPTLLKTRLSIVPTSPHTCLPIRSTR
jgi:hypothetical protein